tara:strand:- start:51 stop:278 length:228 start_codon:yes stop_codon:yes gene_type:complete
MDIKKLKLAIEQAQKVCNEMNKCANKFILQDSINEMNQALTIPVVVGTLFCEYCQKWVKKECDCGNKELARDETY